MAGLANTLKSVKEVAKGTALVGVTARGWKKSDPGDPPKSPLPQSKLSFLNSTPFFANPHTPTVMTEQEKIAQSLVDQGRLVALGFQQQLEDDGFYEKTAGIGTYVDDVARRGYNAVRSGAGKAKETIVNSARGAKEKVKQKASEAGEYADKKTRSAGSMAMKNPRKAQRRAGAAAVGIAGTGAAGGYYAGNKKEGSFGNRLAEIANGGYDDGDLFGGLL